MCNEGILFYLKKKRFMRQGFYLLFLPQNDSQIRHTLSLSPPPDMAVGKILKKIEELLKKMISNMRTTTSKETKRTNVETDTAYMVPLWKYSARITVKNVTTCRNTSVLKTDIEKKVDAGITMQQVNKILGCAHFFLMRAGTLNRRSIFHGLSMGFSEYFL